MPFILTQIAEVEKRAAYASACTCRSTLYVWTGQCTARACAWATPITNISECHCQKGIGGQGDPEI